MLGQTDIYDIVPTGLLAEGCPWCHSGWAMGPGLAYRCECNPGEPRFINEGDEQKPRAENKRTFFAWLFGLKP